MAKDFKPIGQRTGRP